MQTGPADPGRPVPISLKKTFEASIREFRTLGLEQTTFTRLSEITGVPVDRLCQTFNNTENLFYNVVKWYITRYEHQILSGFALHSDPVEAIRCALYECIELFCEDDCPHGCLLSVELMEISDTNGVIAREMSKLREEVYDRIYAKLIGSSLRTPGQSVEEHAEYYTSVLDTIIKRACDGTSRNELYVLADASIERLENPPTVH